MATRKLFDATTRYLTTTHDEDNTSSKSILNSNKIDLKLLKTAQIREANSSKLEINKRFLNSTMVNTLQGNMYKDSNNMYRAKKRKEELEEKLVGLDGTMKTPGTNKRLRDDSAEKRYASSSSPSSSSDDEDQDDKADVIEDKIQKLLLLSKSKRGRGLIGARMDGIVKTTPKNSKNKTDSEIFNQALASLERKAKNKRRRKEKKEKKEKKDKKKEKSRKGSSARKKKM